MIRKLSLREKILVSIAVMLAVLCAGYYLLLLPAENSYRQAEQKYEEAEGRRLMADSILEMEKDIRRLAGDGEAYYRECQGKLALSMDSVEMETDVLGRMERHQIAPVSVSVEDVRDVEEAISKKEGNSGIKLEPALKMGSVLVTATGTWGDFFQMMDEMQGETGVYVASFHLLERYNVDRQPLSSPEEGIYDIQFTVEYYMANEQPAIEESMKK